MAACDGLVLKAALQQAEAHVRGRIDEINALNVFPIPDGDTGTNLHLTMQAAAKALANLEEHSVGKVMSIAARAALLGARGNSGVIFSQILRGLAKGLEAKERISCNDFAHALALASEQAYKTVINPVEGTILTVIREASEAAQSAAQRTEEMSDLMRELLSRVEKAVQDTQHMLPVLRDAGVVDAGGKGLYYFFEGMTRAIAGLPGFAAATPAAVGPEVGASYEEYGFEVQCLIEGIGMSVDVLRDRLAAMGESVLVVGDESLIRVHIHTMRPGEVLEIAAGVGRVTEPEVTNLDSQAEDFQRRHGI